MAIVVVVARIKAQAGKQQEVESELRKLTEYVRNEEPGTLTYLFHRAQNDPSRFLFYERYLSDDAFQKHTSSSRFLQVVERITPLLEDPPAIEMYEEIAGKR